MHERDAKSCSCLQRMYSCLPSRDILLRAPFYVWNYQQSAVKLVSSPRKSTRSYPGAPRAEGVDE